MSDENATPDNGQDVPATATNDIPENPPQGGQPEPQGKPEGQQNATGGAETPPETYVLDLPDYPGSPEELQFVTEMAQKSGLPAEAASTFLQRAANYQQILHEKTVEAWAEASRNDPE